MRAVSASWFAAISVRRFSASALITDERLHRESDLPVELQDFERLLPALISSSRCSRSRSIRAVSSGSSSAICSRSVCSRDLDLGFVERPAAGDLALLRSPPRCLMRASVIARSCASRAFSTSSRDGELRLLRLLLAQRPVLGELDALRGAADLDVVLLLEPRVFGLPLDIEDLRCASRFWVRISIRVRCSISLRILRRVSIDLGELGQALGVEGVGLIEEFEAGLVEVDDRDALELEAVGGEPLGGEVADLLGVVVALLVHFLERHLRRDRAQRRGELALQQVRGCRPTAACAGRASARAAHLLRGSSRRARRTRR